MNPGSLPPLSPEARGLLSAERDLSPQPDIVRRRALLRARTALWHARGLRDVQPELGSMWKRLRFMAVAALCATSAVAAWLTVKPTSHSDSPPVVLTSHIGRPAPVQIPSPRVSPVAPEQAQLSPPRLEENAHDSEAAPTEPAPTNSSRSRSRAVSSKARGSSAEELALLDSARRAVVAGDFAAALNAIQRHARSFPKSQLGEEREALRVRALKGAGLSKKAAEAARKFESRYPKSVLAPELNKSHQPAP